MQTPHRPPRKGWNDEDARALSEVLLDCGRLVGVIFLDVRGCITGWSEGCHFMLGFEAHEVLGQPVSLIFTPEDRERRLDAHELRAARKLGAAEDERWHVRKDGSRFWASGVTLPLLGDVGLRGYIKMFKDASHLGARMKALENEVRQAAAAAARQGSFLASVAHELRNPLGTLKTVAELLGRPEADGQRTQLMQITHRQLGLLERLVEDLVDLARADAGKLTLTYRTVDLQQLLAQALQSCRARAEAQGVGLGMLLPEVPIGVVVDADRVHQVVVNLLNNAIKFTPPDGSVVMLANVDATHFVVQVRDTGVGIGPDLLPRIFDMFTQADGAGSQRGTGLGVGLALVKQIVSLHQGTVEVRSEGPGKGSEFMVRIPLLPPLLPPLPPPPAARGEGPGF